MRAAVYDRFKGPIQIREVPDPEPPHGGVVVKVEANGICRSDWHGWMGHDPDITPPHVPGHEIAGTVEAVGADVSRWSVGDRVTVPFIAGCGRCGPCRSGNQQVCDRQFQPGFHGWGGFAEYVALQHADLTLVPLPSNLDYVTAAGLGCRFATAWRAVVAQGRVRVGQWVAVHGCGGVGLAAVMIARALGALVVAVDIRDAALAEAKAAGATAVVRSPSGSAAAKGGGAGNGSIAADPDAPPPDGVDAVKEVTDEIRDITGGGAHVSLDALGHRDTAMASMSCLRKRGRHVQVGLMIGEASTTAVPWGTLIGHELEVVGSHGMQAHEYDEMLRAVDAGFVDPGSLVRQRVGLEEGIDILMGMDTYDLLGVAVIHAF
ncbi:MAG: zinc-dependent alcohol dehydrogenase family protein [Gemmatimonadetes bacterium]|nr:zinc-dependent alcohol dehydrogenase family protein [Gemmatimonadota bacterium]